MKVFKYKLSTEFGLLGGYSSTMLLLPERSEILSAGVQNLNGFNEFDVWVSVDPEEETKMITKEIIVVPAGAEFEKTKGYNFVQTIFLDWLVFHIFVRDVE